MTVFLNRVVFFYFYKNSPLMALLQVIPRISFVTEAIPLCCKRVLFDLINILFYQSKKYIFISW